MIEIEIRPRFVIVKRKIFIYKLLLVKKKKKKQIVCNLVISFPLLCKLMCEENLRNFYLEFMENSLTASSLVHFGFGLLENDKRFFNKRKYSIEFKPQIFSRQLILIRPNRREYPDTPSDPYITAKHAYSFYK